MIVDDEHNKKLTQVLYITVKMRFSFRQSYNRHHKLADFSTVSNTITQIHTVLFKSLSNTITQIHTVLFKSLSNTITQIHTVLFKSLSPYIIYSIY